MYGKYCVYCVYLGLSRYWHGRQSALRQEGAVLPVELDLLRRWRGVERRQVQARGGIGVEQVRTLTRRTVTHFVS